jgi:hypothetical protein
MCPTSIVYSKASPFYMERGEKKKPPQHNSHTYRRTMDPCLGNAALQKYDDHPFTHTDHGERNIWVPISGECPIPKPYQQGSCGRGCHPFAMIPPACVVSTAVYIIPHTVVNFFPLPNTPTNSQVPSMDFCTEEQGSGRFLGIIGCHPSVCKSSRWLHVDIPPGFPL